MSEYNKITSFEKYLLNTLKAKKSIKDCLILLGKSKNRLDLNEYDKNLIQIGIFMINKKIHPCTGIPFESELMAHLVKLQDWRISHEWIYIIDFMFPEYKITITEPQIFFSTRYYS